MHYKIAEMKDSIRKLSERLDRKLDMSIAVVHKNIDCIKARLEAKAPELEGRIDKEKAEINNDKRPDTLEHEQIRGKVRYKITGHYRMDP
jgi:hypothetical protein